MIYYIYNGDKMNKRNDKSIYFLLILSVLTFIIMIIGTSFAYFTFVVKGNVDNSYVKLQTTDVVLYSEGESLSAIGIFPGWKQEMNILLTNQTSVDSLISYSLNWDIIENTINSEDFVYSINCKSFKNGREIPSNKKNTLPIPRSHLKIPTISTTIGNGVISSGVTHKCKINFEFIDNGEQNQLQGKNIKVKVYPVGKSTVLEG